MVTAGPRVGECYAVTRKQRQSHRLVFTTSSSLTRETHWFPISHARSYIPNIYSSKSARGTLLQRHTSGAIAVLVEKGAFSKPFLWSTGQEETMASVLLRGMSSSDESQIQAAPSSKNHRWSPLTHGSTSAVWSVVSLTLTVRTRRPRWMKCRVGEHARSRRIPTSKGDGNDTAAAATTKHGTHFALYALGPLEHAL